jgi:hypothetical protein
MLYLTLWKTASVVGLRVRRDGDCDGTRPDPVAAADPKAPAYCGATKKSGDGHCKRPQGWGTNHPGVGRCKLHGGASPQAEVTGVVQLARREAVVMGAPIDNLTPEVALLECIRIAGGEVAYASERIAELQPEDAVGPVITTRPLKEEKGAEHPSERVYEEGPPALHIWIEVRAKAMDRLVKYSEVAIKAGLEERRVRVAEAQGQLMAEAVRGILVDLGVAEDPRAPEVVRRHLTRMSTAGCELTT